MTSRASRGAAQPGIRVHQFGQQDLVERAPVHPDTHRLVVPERHFDDGAEILVGSLTANIPGVDAILGERAGTVGVPGEQNVPVVVEVADDQGP